MAKILIIEDEESIRRLLRYDLRQMKFEVDSAHDAEAGIEMALANYYDVLIVDWMLPQKSGIDLIKQVRKSGNDAIIVMLTAKDNEEDILDAFEAGVDDYITKPFSPRELSARIQAHLRRYSGKENTRSIQIQNTSIDLDMHVVYVENDKIELTKKEFDLFLYLIRNLNIVLSRDQILTEIWNFDYDGDTRIVDVHIHKLRSKLENSNISIQSLRGVGYVAKTE